MRKTTGLPHEDRPNSALVVAGSDDSFENDRLEQQTAQKHEQHQSTRANLCWLPELASEDAPTSCKSYHNHKNPLSTPSVPQQPQQPPWTARDQVKLYELFPPAPRRDAAIDLRLGSRVATSSRRLTPRFPVKGDHAKEYRCKLFVSAPPRTVPKQGTQDLKAKTPRAQPSAGSVGLGASSSHFATLSSKDATIITETDLSHLFPSSPKKLVSPRRDGTRREPPSLYLTIEEHEAILLERTTLAMQLFQSKLAHLQDSDVQYLQNPHVTVSCSDPSVEPTLYTAASTPTSGALYLPPDSVARMQAVRLAGLRREERNLKDELKKLLRQAEAAEHGLEAAILLNQEKARVVEKSIAALVKKQNERVAKGRPSTYTKSEMGQAKKDAEVLEHDTQAVVDVLRQIETMARKLRPGEPLRLPRTAKSNPVMDRIVRVLSGMYTHSEGEASSSDEDEGPFLTARDSSDLTLYAVSVATMPTPRTTLPSASGTPRTVSPWGEGAGPAKAPSTNTSQPNSGKVKPRASFEEDNSGSRTDEKEASHPKRTMLLNSLGSIEVDNTNSEFVQKLAISNSKKRELQNSSFVPEGTTGIISRMSFSKPAQAKPQGLVDTPAQPQPQPPVSSNPPPPPPVESQTVQRRISEVTSGITRRQSSTSSVLRDVIRGRRVSDNTHISLNLPKRSATVSNDPALNNPVEDLVSPSCLEQLTLMEATAMACRDDIKACEQRKQLMERHYIRRGLTLLDGHRHRTPEQALKVSIDNLDDETRDMAREAGLEADVKLELAEASAALEVQRSACQRALADFERAKREIRVLQSGSMEERMELMTTYAAELARMVAEEEQRLRDGLGQLEDDPSRDTLRMLWERTEKHKNSEKISIGIQNTLGAESRGAVSARVEALFKQERRIRMELRNLRTAIANVSHFAHNLEVSITCPVCLQHYTEPVLLRPCGHSVCNECLALLFQKETGDRRCAECNTELEDDVIPNIMLQQFTVRWKFKTMTTGELEDALAMLQRDMGDIERQLDSESDFLQSFTKMLHGGEENDRVVTARKVGALLQTANAFSMFKRQAAAIRRMSLSKSMSGIPKKPSTASSAHTQESSPPDAEELRRPSDASQAVELTPHE